MEVCVRVRVRERARTRESERESAKLLLHTEVCVCVSWSVSCGHGESVSAVRASVSGKLLGFWGTFPPQYEPLGTDRSSRAELPCGAPVRSTAASAAKI